MRALIPEPKPGDLIEIFRPFYSHWAIYVGDGYVIHLAPPIAISDKETKAQRLQAPSPKPHSHVLDSSTSCSSPVDGVYSGCPGEVAGAGVASIMSALTEKAIVKKELLCDVVGKDKYKVNNKHDDKYQPQPPRKVLQRAEEMVGQEVPYKLTSENCEHFVNDLRYGVPRSDQVRDAVKVASLAGAGLAAAFIGYMVSRSKKQNQ